MSDNQKCCQDTSSIVQSTIITYVDYSFLACCSLFQIICSLFTCWLFISSIYRLCRLTILVIYFLCRLNFCPGYLFSMLTYYTFVQMTRCIRHVRTNRATSCCGSHGSASHGTSTASTSEAAQRTRGAPQKEEPPKKIGRKPGRKTELALPKLGTKVALKPSGDK